MLIGLSSYVFFWRGSDRVSHPVTLEAMLDETAELGGQVFQICDYAPIEGLTPQELERLRQRAESLSLVLELGTRGLERPHLLRYLELARALNVTLLRTMVYGKTSKPTLDEAQRQLQDVLPSFADQGVRVCLETYEQIPVQRLVDLIKRFQSAWLGICLDPGNNVAALEAPRDVVDRTSPYVFNLHVKDFAFTRSEGWVGFTLAGCPLGEGLLDYAYMRQVLRPRERNINQIVENWLPWQGDEEKTCRLEQEWTRHNLAWLLRINQGSD
jgi:sugar phosphate isomerase/epimerase